MSHSLEDVVVALGERETCAAGSERESEREGEREKERVCKEHTSLTERTESVEHTKSERELHTHTEDIADTLSHTLTHTLSLSLSPHTQSTHGSHNSHDSHNAHDTHTATETISVGESHSAPPHNTHSDAVLCEECECECECECVERVSRHSTRSHSSHNSHHSHNSHNSVSSSSSSSSHTHTSSLSHTQTHPHTLTPTERYFCQICYEPHTLAEHAHYTLSLCGHRFCRDCLKQFLKSHIYEGDVRHLRCFFVRNLPLQRETERQNERERERCREAERERGGDEEKEEEKERDTEETTLVLRNSSQDIEKDEQTHQEPSAQRACESESLSLTAVHTDTHAEKEKESEDDDVCKAEISSFDIVNIFTDPLAEGGLSLAHTLTHTLTDTQTDTQTDTHTTAHSAHTHMSAVNPFSLASSLSRFQHSHTQHRLSQAHTHTEVPRSQSDRDVLDKFYRFTLQQTHTNARECPFCHTLSASHTADETNPRIVCEVCRGEYCFTHSNAHNFSIYATCAEYEKAMANSMKESEALIREETKPCPRCSMPVMKTGGCNHMKCRCGAAFCWLCGREIDDDTFPAHFQWWNPAGCPNMQMNEEVNPSLHVRLGARCLATMQFVFLGPITIVSTCLSFFLCCCCIAFKVREDERTSMNKYGITGRLRRLFGNCMAGWGMFWLFLLCALPLGIALGSVAVAVLIAIGVIIYPCYAVYRLQARQYPWPDVVTRFAHRTLESLRSCGRCVSRCLCRGRCRRETRDEEEAQAVRDFYFSRPPNRSLSRSHSHTHSHREREGESDSGRRSLDLIFRDLEALDAEIVRLELEHSLQEYMQQQQQQQEQQDVPDSNNNAMDNFNSDENESDIEQGANTSSKMQEMDGFNEQDDDGVRVCDVLTVCDGLQLTYTQPLTTQESPQEVLSSVECEEEDTLASVV